MSIFKDTNEVYKKIIKTIKYDKNYKDDKGDKDNKQASKIVPSNEQTKIWRKKQCWYKGGKRNECEKYQIYLINKIIKTPLKKTHARLNVKTLQLIDNINPLLKDDGFDWTENFDGIYINKHASYYFNLKFVCDSGGAQTRTLREVYHFIRIQLDYLCEYNSKCIINNTNKNNIIIINILDGDTSFKYQSKFKYLINDKKYEMVQPFIFCGDMLNFQSWWDSSICPNK